MPNVTLATRTVNAGARWRAGELLSGRIPRVLAGGRRSAFAARRSPGAYLDATPARSCHLWRHATTSAPLSSSTARPNPPPRIAWYQKQLFSGQLSARDLPLLMPSLARGDQAWQLVCAAALEDSSAALHEAVVSSADHLSPQGKLNALNFLVDNMQGSDRDTRLTALAGVLLDGAVTGTALKERQQGEHLFHILSCAVRDRPTPLTTGLLTSAHVESLVRSVLAQPADDLACCVNDVGERLDQTAIHVAELYLTNDVLARLYTECGGLHFESTAYRNGAQTLEEPLRLPTGKGFGDTVCALLAAKQLALLLAATPPTRMPPRLAKYTEALLSLSVARRLREEASRIGATKGAALSSPPPPPVPELRPDDGAETTHLERVSDFHFRYRCGTAQTALTLLPRCTTRGQIAAVMGYASEAGVHASFEAATELLRVRPSDALFVSMRLSDPSRRGRHRRVSVRPAPRVLAFEVKLAPLAVTRAEDSPPHSAASAATPLAADSTGHAFAVESLWRALSHPDVLPLPHNPFRRTGSQSSEDALGSIAEGHIAGLLASVPHLRASQVSSWGALLIRRGNLPAARTLFSSAAQRHLAPDLMTVVEFLEAHHRTEPSSVQGAAQFVRTQFPAVAPNAFRAFMERLCSARSDASAGHLDAVTALQLLLYATDNDLHHLPPECLGVVASGRCGADVCALLDVLSPHRTACPPPEASMAATRSPVRPPDRVPPLCLAALRQLVETLDELGLQPALDFFSLSTSSKNVLWWSAVDAATSKCASQRLYETGASALWRLAAHELQWGRLTRPTLAAKAVRLTCLGSHDAPRLASTLDLGLDWLASPPNQPRRLSPAEEAALLPPTLICASEVLCAMGERELALTLLPSDSGNAPAALRTARLRAELGTHPVPPRTTPADARNRAVKPGRVSRRQRPSSARKKRPSRRSPRLAHEQTLATLGFSRPLCKLVASSVYAPTFFALRTEK